MPISAMSLPGAAPQARHVLLALAWVCMPLQTRAQEQTLPVVTVTAPLQRDMVLNARHGLADRQAAATDTAELLKGLGGVSLYGAGGTSSLPVLRGLADDRIRIRVDGMDLQPACPNHMNAPLSYVAPVEVARVIVNSGVTPVSSGGDSLAGTIEVSRERPAFAEDDTPLTRAEVGGFYRSNGRARGAHLKAAWGGQAWSFSYSGNTGRADNFQAARAFKAETAGTEGGAPLSGDEVGSSAYQFANHDAGVAWRSGRHLVRLNVGQQHVGFEGYPNQRMDMTDNLNHTVNVRYEGVQHWGRLDARLSTQRTRHAMDMGPDRYTFGTGMPMLTKAQTDSGEVHATWDINDDNLVQAGAEFLYYRLYDWWPPVDGQNMGPEAFWNIDNGRRNRLGAYVEWTHNLDDGWQSLMGVRHEQVTSDASPVQGYNNGEPGAWGDDAAAFNARQHRRVDRNWDLTLLMSRELDTSSRIELGYARKTRSPSLYQRYPWSTNSMAALMNNFVGDGNGYVGNEDLTPEVAHTISVGGQWRADTSSDWMLKANAYVTRIDDYIDAQRCTIGSCGNNYLTDTDSFVLLQYANQSARIVGMDLSGMVSLGRSDTWGHFELQGVLNLLRGDNLTTGEPLYNMMPANATLSLVQHLAQWRHALEWQLVAGKRRVSGVRNEIPTPGYALLNLKSSRTWSKARLDLGIDNLLNRFYRQPLGGAYVGQGNSMSTGTIAWGQVVPGPGRSVSMAVNVQY